MAEDISTEIVDAERIPGVYIDVVKAGTKARRLKSKSAQTQRPDETMKVFHLSLKA
jgi:hypothetical protein